MINQNRIESQSSDTPFDEVIDTTNRVEIHLPDYFSTTYSKEKSIDCSNFFKNITSDDCIYIDYLERKHLSSGMNFRTNYKFRNDLRKRKSYSSENNRSKKDKYDQNLDALKKREIIEEEAQIVEYEIDQELEEFMRSIKDKENYIVNNILLEFNTHIINSNNNNESKLNCIYNKIGKVLNLQVSVKEYLNYVTSVDDIVNSILKSINDYVVENDINTNKPQILKLDEKFTDLFVDLDNFLKKMYTFNNVSKTLKST